MSIWTAWCVIIGFVLLHIFLIYFLTVRFGRPHAMPPLLNGSTPDEFKDAIAARAIDNTIILVCVDSGYLQMALNLYKTSFEPLAIDNYLYVGIDRKICGNLSVHGIACVMHSELLFEESSVSNWGTTDFRLKTHFKTKVILEALTLNLNVVITDVDIVFFKNPIPHFVCKECDIEITNDVSEGNSGFYLARPTEAAKIVHQRAWEIGVRRGGSVSNQKVLNSTMQEMLWRKQIKIKNLSKERFPNRVQYFEHQKRFFAKHTPKCDKCVIVHNNWILSNDAKTYRFKEAGLWKVDTDQYYTSTTRKYLSYQNPVVLTKREDSRTLEKDALYTALYLGHLLNRTVILPPFHWNEPCADQKCKKMAQRPLNSILSISTFNQWVGENNYRESSFFWNPLVPESVKTSSTEKFLINSQKLQEMFLNYPEHFLVDKKNTLMPRNLKTGPTEREVLTWFSKYKNISVLTFHSLYGVFHLDSEDKSDFSEVLQKALKNAAYRQL